MLIEVNAGASEGVIGALQVQPATTHGSMSAAAGQLLDEVVA